MGADVEGGFSTTQHNACARPHVVLLQEVSKLANDVKEGGLNLVVLGEWYNVESMLHMKFFDDNTRSWWTPATGACACEGGKGEGA